MAAGPQLGRRTLLGGRPTRPRLPYPRNPRFGSGAARRRIELVSVEYQARARLIDSFHEMECEIVHDGTHVTTVSAAMHRYPTTLCPGAVSVLQELVGSPVSCSGDHYYAAGAVRRHCTHLFDLAYLAVSQAGRGPGRRTYDVVVPDECNASVLVEVARDGAAMLTWTVRDGSVVAPAELAGLPLLGGFWARAAEHFAGDALEAALVLARTYLIAVGRAYDSEAWAGQPSSRNDALSNRCYGYSSAHGDRGEFRAGYVRDFSGGIPRGGS
jgi:hypothetical protein